MPSIFPLQQAKHHKGVRQSVAYDFLLPSLTEMRPGSFHPDKPVQPEVQHRACCRAHKKSLLAGAPGDDNAAWWIIQSVQTRQACGNGGPDRGSIARSDQA